MRRRETRERTPVRERIVLGRVELRVLQKLLSDLDAFFQAASGLLKPDGTMFVATLNRTVKSFAFAIVGAEYVLRWLPRGTHDWRRFMRPSELARQIRGHGLEMKELAGVSYNPIGDSFSLGRDCGVNYMAVAVHR